MVFSSSFFIFFFLPLCFIFYFNPFIKSIKYKNIVLLVFSILFYCWGSLKYLWVLLLSIIINYIFGILIEKFKKRFLVFIDILFNVGLLFIFKLLGFYETFSDFSKILPFVGPLGISFFTFQEISYIVDVYRNIVPAQKNIIKYSLYVSFFPQLIAGPIIRYDDIYKEINDRKVSLSNISDGFHEFIIGLFKKCAIADIIGNCALIMFTNRSSSLCASWLCAISFVLQLYYDFSGYSNMAIGLGKIFGFNIKKNFDYPYASSSVNEYWKKWNISLGNWFNDYILYPICNSKIYKFLLKKMSFFFNKKVCFKIMNYIALFICWLLVGLWHGIGINYVYLGIFYFLFLTIEKQFKFPKKKNLFSHIYTLFVVIIGTVLFFSYNDPKFEFLKSMFINKKFIDNRVYLYLQNYWLYYVIGIIFSFPILKNVKIKLKKIKFYSLIDSIFIFIIFLIGIYYMIINSYNPFIYFNF